MHLFQRCATLEPNTYPIKLPTTVESHCYQSINQSITLHKRKVMKIEWTSLNLLLLSFCFSCFNYAEGAVVMDLCTFRRDVELQMGLIVASFSTPQGIGSLGSFLFPFVLKRVMFSERSACSLLLLLLLPIQGLNPFRG